MADKALNSTPANLIELKKTKKEIPLHGQLIVWDFYQTDCAPCRLMEPTIRQLATEFPAVDFVKVNVAKHPQMAAAYGVIGFPTIVIQDVELIVLVEVGRMPAAKLRAAIKAALKEKG